MARRPSGWRPPLRLRTAIGIVLGLTAAACDAQTDPSDIAPVSRLWYDKPADAVSGTDVGRWATANAQFSGRVFTSCTTSPLVDNGICPSLMVWMSPSSLLGGSCQLVLYAPEGETLGVRSYPRAARLPAPGVAGLWFWCSGQPACGSLDGSFTVHRLESNAEQVITTMHATFDQTCRDGTGVPLGRLTGEWWIVKGTSGSPFTSGV